VIPITDQLSKNLSGNHKTSACVLESLERYAQPGDLLIALSARDPSSQALKAVEWANAAGLVTWALTAHNSVRLRKQAQHHLGVPLTDVGLVEAIHLLLMHWVLDDVSARLHQLGRYAPPEAVPVAS
jgi:D-sedoheptulose 7-phosphate isomerase